MAAHFLFYFIVFPITFILGIPVNIAASIKLWSKVGTEPSFIYLLVQCTNCVACLALCTMWMAVHHWTGVMVNRGPHWMMSSDLVMYTSAFVIDPTCNVFITASVFLILVGCLDRVLAVKKPLIYRTMEKKKFVLGSVTVIYLISIPLTIPDAFRMQIFFNETLNEYRVYENKAYTSALGPKLLISVRSLVRIVAVLCILILNVFIRKALSDYRNNVQKLKANSIERKSDELKRNLTLILLVQSVLVSFGQISMSIEYIMLYFDLSENSRWYMDTLSNLAFLSEMAANPLIILFPMNKWKIIIDCLFCRRRDHIQ